MNLFVMIYPIDEKVIRNEHDGRAQLERVPINCDKTSAISSSRNLIQCSRTKNQIYHFNAIGLHRVRRLGNTFHERTLLYNRWVMHHKITFNQSMT